MATDSGQGRKLTKNEKRRAKKKSHNDDNTSTPIEQVVDGGPPSESNGSPPANGTEHTEDDPAQVDFDNPDRSLEVVQADDPLASQYANVFAKFEEHEDEADAEGEATALNKPQVFYDDDDMIQGEDEEEETQKKISKRSKKKAGTLSIAELKAIVRKPEVVEWTDISAQDPRLLVAIKSARNIVPVPGHWNLKREYLSGKRGIEKPGFALPTFIAETGIGEMRAATLEQDAKATLKQKQRERVQPKMGKLDMDYSKLYEAFFRRQTKPSLTRYGEVYYEGKENETNLRHLRPGNLSDDVKEALNIPPGAPPPWLIHQQRHGPPPGYPAIKIPGLNAPPPPGAQWGFHPGGYGKPPTDEQGKPIYGGSLSYTDDSGKEAPAKKNKYEVVDQTPFGELAPVEESSEEESDSDEEDEEADQDEDGGEEHIGTGLETPFGGTETSSGITSNVPTEFGGLPSFSGEFNLRKQRRGTDTDGIPYSRSAGTVLKEQSIRNEGFFGGERKYDLSATKRAPENVPMLGQESTAKKRKAGDMDVSMDVDALERNDQLSREEIKRSYDEQAAREGAGRWQGKVDQEDLSQMIAEESAKRQKKDAERNRRR